MQVQALTKFVRMSPKKVREVTREIQGRPASEALELLRFVPRKSARLVHKTLKSAVANAENNNNLASDSLVIERAVVEQAPTYPRWRAGARGMVKPIRKKNCHIRIVLSEKEVAEETESQD